MNKYIFLIQSVIINEKEPHTGPLPGKELQVVNGNRFEHSLLPGQEYVFPQNPELDTDSPDVTFLTDSDRRMVELVILESFYPNFNK